MTEETMVTVYHFRLIQHPIENLVLASYKATLPAIQALGGDVLPGTEQRVPASAVDAQGRYRRRVTGWDPRP